MSIQTDLFCRLSFFGATYNSLVDVERGIREASEAIQEAKSEIRDLVMMTEPQKFFTASDEKGNVYEQVTERIEQIFESMEEWVCKLHDLYYLRDNWEYCHVKGSGLAIPPPENINSNTAYYHGDYVKTVNDKE